MVDLIADSVKDILDLSFTYHYDPRPFIVDGWRQDGKPIYIRSGHRYLTLRFPSEYDSTCIRCDIEYKPSSDYDYREPLAQYDYTDPCTTSAIQIMEDALILADQNADYAVLEGDEKSSIAAISVIDGNGDHIAIDLRQTGFTQTKWEYLDALDEEYMFGS